MIYQFFHLLKEGGKKKRNIPTAPTVPTYLPDSITKMHCS